MSGTKIFVGHLPDGCSNEELQALFEKYGTVTECDVINKYGFVHMSSPDEVTAAIKSLNNYNFRGSNLSVEISKSRLHKEPGTPGRAKRNADQGGPMRNGYRQGRPPYPYADGYGASPYGSDPYYDRSYAYSYDRMHPYAYPYDRPSEYASRPMHPSASADYYGRPMPASYSREDLYERRSEAAAMDHYMYSRRAPAATSMGKADWYGDSYGYSSSSSSMMPSATRRPAYY